MTTSQITVVGLGSGDENQLTMGVWRTLQQAEHLYLRTADHPVVAFFDDQQLNYQTFDHYYEQCATFDDVYDKITSELVAKATAVDGAHIVYAVPGHPMVAEATTQLLKEKCADRVKLTIISGESFLDQAFLRLGFDPIDGFQLLDGGELHASLLQPAIHTIITQVYDRLLASDVKLTLMEHYPDDHSITVAHSLGVLGEEQVLTMPLYDIDRHDGYGNRSLIWIPPTESDVIRNRQFSRLQEIITLLRSPEGCPWDQEQTHESIRENLIEETYEVLEAIDDDDPDAMCEELGDLLMQIMLHAEMEAEQGTFTITDVIANLNEKLIRRHPHVFANKEVGDAEEALQSWQQIKAEERANKGEDETERSILDGIPRELPSIIKAWQLQKRAAKVGFDWPELDGVMAKLAEEIAELEQALEQAEAAGNTNEISEELGDILFSTINVARFLQIDPDLALTQANRKFMARFNYIEQKLRLKDRQFEQTDLQQMEAWWQEAKQDQETTRVKKS